LSKAIHLKIGGAGIQNLKPGVGVREGVGEGRKNDPNIVCKYE
jgi:hypothetical protein